MPLATGGYQLVVGCSPRRAVQLKGDLTDWEPVELPQTRGTLGVCSTVLQAAPGVYHVLMRTDQGPWSVPPGLTPVPDGLGGVAGLLSLAVPS